MPRVKILSIPMGDGGKVRPPIYTSDKNDPKIKAYQDSLNAYNKSHDVFENEKTYHKAFVDRYEKDRHFWQDKASYKVSEIPNDSPNAFGTLVNKRAMYFNMTPEKTMSIASYIPGNAGGGYLGHYPLYKQPVQPVEYRETVQQSKQKEPIYVSNKNDPRLKSYNDSLRKFDIDSRLLERWNKSYPNGLSMNIPENMNIDSLRNVANNLLDDASKIDPTGHREIAHPKRKSAFPDEYATIAPMESHYPKQPVKLRPQQNSIQRLPVMDVSPEQIYLQQVQIPNLPPIIQDKGWYSNSQGVPYNAEDVSKLYNEDGTRKYQQGGQVMKQRVRIVGIPEMAYGGNTPGQYNQLDTRWNTGNVYAGMASVMPDPNPYERTGRVLSEVSDEQAQNSPNVINAEKDEQVLGQFTPDGQPSLMSVDGPPHTEGGKNVAVPNNSFVFSDTQALKIKNPEILKLFNETKGKTPAGIARKYNLSKYTKVIADPNTDNVSKKTAQMMVDNMTGKLNQLADVQESLKAAKGIADNSAPQQMQPPMQQYGGTQSWNSKYSTLLQHAKDDLQRLYPGKKVDIQESSGYRNPSTQADIVKRGNSTTDVSLHALNAAKDYQILIDGKVSKDPNLYHQVIWKNAEKQGLYHLDPKGFGATDLGHIGVVEEDGKSTYGRLIDQYPEVKNMKEYGDLQKFLKDKVASGKATEKENLVYNQINGQRYTPELWYKPMYGDNKVPQPISIATTPKAVNKIAKDNINRLPVANSHVPIVNSGNNPQQVPVSQPAIAQQDTAQSAPDYNMNQWVMDQYKSDIYKQAPKQYGGYMREGGVPNLKRLDARWDQAIPSDDTSYPQVPQYPYASNDQSEAPYMPYVTSFPQNIYPMDNSMGMNIPAPQPTNMQAIGDLMGTSDNMASYTPTFNKDSFTDDDREFRSPFGVPTPNKMGIADSLLNLASVHRYPAWEAPIGAVLPTTTYMDPTRALAANSEVANSMSYNNALSGNSRAARASNLALQGEAGKSAADIVGNYANQNTQIANRSSEQAAEIMNRLQSMQAERSNRLYQGNVTAAQQYDNATRQGRNDLTKQLQEAWKDRQAYDDINQTNQYYYRDPKSGRITFRPGMDTVAYNQITSGRGASNFNSPEQIADYYKSHGITDQKVIADAQDDWIREHQLDLRNRTKTTTKSGNTTTQSTSYNKYGGYTNKLRKFTM